MIPRDDVIRYLEAVHDHTVLKTLDMRIERYDPDETVVTTEVSERLYQPAGVVHGGVYVLMAESAASTAAALSVDLAHNTVFGMSIDANHIRPVSRGRLRAVARPFHKGRTTMVYGIEVRDEQDRLVSVARCTVAVRPRRQDPPDVDT